MKSPVSHQFFAYSLSGVMGLGLYLCLAVANAAPLASHVKSVEDMQYGVVLYDYFQQNYFSALVEHEYLLHQANDLASSTQGKMLQGGMLLAYGMPDQSQSLFSHLLNDAASAAVSNRVWYYLAKIYYHKSDINNARQALDSVQHPLPDDVLFDYYYLSTLIGKPQHFDTIERQIQSQLAHYLPGYPYLLFNMAIHYLQRDERQKATAYLTQVAQFADAEAADNDELTVLADRAKNGLAQLSLASGQLQQAWNHLSAVRTSGLYSNRALLAYAWSAVQLQRYPEAIAALKILNDRSIAIPEVQEAKVLLSHLYEQQGYQRQALQSHIAAEETFAKGMQRIASARKAIEKLEVPLEFVNNIRAIKTQFAWYSSLPEVDYSNLTPFLLDLMSSNAFNEVLKELADLYSIRNNLTYWLARSDEHKIILTSAQQKNFNQQLQAFFQKSEHLGKAFTNQEAELQLYTLGLEEDDQQRMTALRETVEKELLLLASKVDRLLQVKSAYKQPEHFVAMVDDHHLRLQAMLKETEHYIAALEPVMRKLVNLELDKHEQRMHYYWAQSRLAKTRLYDAELLSLETAAVVKPAGVQQQLGESQ
ncbi:MAG: hypothetical protein KTR20_03000 [Cellvibrionaceae bacterium]|nr:hypothetical protein [Cellvibrionaceae bacterium]